MRPAGPRESLLGVGHVGLGHDLETSAVIEGQEVRAEVRAGVVIALVGRGAKVADEEVSRPLEVVDVERSVFDAHGPPLFLCMV